MEALLAARGSFQIELVDSAGAAHQAVGMGSSGGSATFTSTTIPGGVAGQLGNASAPKAIHNCSFQQDVRSQPFGSA